MTLEHLEAMRAQALAHLNICRTVRAAVISGLDDANQARQLLPHASLELHDHVVIAERAATDAYGAACRAVDNHRARLAGLEV